MDLILGLVFLLAGAWGCLALWFRPPFEGRARPLAPAAWAVIALLAVASIGRFPALAWAYGLAIAALLTWWLLWVRPSHARQWMPEVEQQTHGEIQGAIVTLHNVRDFAWRSATDFEARWLSRSHNLDELQSVDVALSYWGRKAIAHTMVCFGFRNGDYTVFSIEIRRKVGDRFSELGGFFRHYELAVLASTEEDSLKVRTNIRGEDGYLFRVKIPQKDAAALFLAYVDTANSLRRRPRFYNTLTANCTTLVYQLVDRVIPGMPLDYRILLSGYLPEYLHALGALEGSASVEDRRRAGRFTDRARAVGDAEDFSSKIREGLPESGPGL